MGTESGGIKSNREAGDRALGEWPWSGCSSRKGFPSPRPRCGSEQMSRRENTREDRKEGRLGAEDALKAKRPGVKE